MMTERLQRLAALFACAAPHATWACDDAPTEPAPTRPAECGAGWLRYDQGTVAWYELAQTTADTGGVNCGHPVEGLSPDAIEGVATGGGGFFAGLDLEDYGVATWCGACVEVRRDDGRKVVATIVDSCDPRSNPRCVKGHLNLSTAAFAEIGELDEGYLGRGIGEATVAWDLVPCPTWGHVMLQLKEPENPSWNAILVLNHTYAIARVVVKVDGAWVETERQPYNYWVPPGGRLGEPPYQVRVHDINGRIIEAWLELIPGPQYASRQFQACDE